MSSEMTIFNQAQPAVPAHIRDAFGDDSNIVGRTTVPTLSFEGKVWQISINGEKQKLIRVNADGDEEPVQIMRVVVLAYNPSRGRSYYEGSYEPGKASAPLCWSEDGKKPHASVKSPICGNCRECPKSAKGSRINDQGRAVVACSEYRMVAVVPAAKMDMEPLRMKLAVTSDWDKNSPDMMDQGWFAFNNYTDFLKTKNVRHTAQIVTKIRFDPNAAYPKLLFSPDRWLTDAEVAIVAPASKSEAVKTLLNGSFTPAGPDGVKTEERAQEPMLAPVPKAEAPAPSVQVPPTKPKAAAAPLMDYDDEDEPVQAPPPVESKKTKKAAKAPEMVEAEPVAVVKSPSVSPAKAAGQLTPEMESILSDWGE